MPLDRLKKFIVKIKFDNKVGTGVLFKPHKYSKYAYIFTAKHTFNPPKNALSIEAKGRLYITKEIDGRECKIIANSSIYFLKEFDEIERDFALLIVEDSTADVLELYDSIDKSDFDKEEIIVAGYPYFTANENIHEKNKEVYPFNLKKIKSEGLVETYISFSGEVSPVVAFDVSEDEYGNSEYLNGLSGAGVFNIGRCGMQRLRAIEYASKHHNNFTCLKLEKVIDEINDKLKGISTNLR